MNGMLSFTFDLQAVFDPASASHQYEFPPTPTIAEMYLTGHYEFDDRTYAAGGFTSFTFLDQDGVTRTVSVDGTSLFIHNGLASATIDVSVSDCAAGWIANFFFWDNVV